MRELLKPKWPETVEAEVGGAPVTVAVRVSARAKSYRLSVSGTGRTLLTVPARGRWREAQAFLERHTAWLEARLSQAVRPVVFAEGAEIPVRGVAHVIGSTGRVRGRVECLETSGDRARLMVPGAPEHLRRRLTDWLKAEALADLDEAVAGHARTLGVRPAAIRLRAQRTRWGSCSSSGRLNFNWRLIMAPPFVLDYVAAHEVAHLLEMNHSPAFWNTVRRTLPDMARGRDWLKANGTTLMAYGLEA